MITIEEKIRRIVGQCCQMSYPFHGSKRVLKLTRRTFYIRNLRIWRLGKNL